jgi:hypothetical protein
MAGDRQHRLPAAFIGGFGEGDGDTRERKVFVRRRGARAPEPATAKSLNYERGIFDTPVGPTLVADDPVEHASLIGHDCRETLIAFAGSLAGEHAVTPEGTYT